MYGSFLHFIGDFDQMFILTFNSPRTDTNPNNIHIWLRNCNACMFPLSVLSCK